MPVALPPLAEQERIVAKVDALMAQCDRLEAQQAEREKTRAFFSEATLGRLQRAEGSELAELWAFTREHFDRAVSRPEDVQVLRQTLLQLAVEGKLTEQRASDEPAEKLLERIEAEKQRLYDAGEIRKPKEFPAITEEQKRFELPKGWRWARVAEICNLENGDRSKNYPRQDELTDSGIPFINAGHLQDRQVGFAEMNYIPESRFEMLRSGKVAEEDVLFCLRGSLGKFAIVNGIERGAIASSLVIVRPLLEVSSNYLLTYFGSALCGEMIDKYNNGTAQPNLGSTSLAKFLIPLPPTEAQSRIVAKVDQLMTFCDELETKLERSRETTSALLDAVLHAAPEEEDTPEAVLQAA